MSYFSRQNCLAVLALLLLSHAAVTLHVTTHIPVDPAKCEYCAGNTNPAHAITTPAAELPRAALPAIEIAGAVAAPSVLRRAHYRERAPPVLV
jgi:hypothetical protein